MKIFKVAHMRDLEAQVAQGEISYSRMVERMNEMTSEIFHKKMTQWFEEKKKDQLECIQRYRNFHYQRNQFSRALADHERTLSITGNAIDNMRMAIIAARKSPDTADGMVGVLNKMIDEYNDAEERYRECISDIAKNTRLIEDYDRDNDKELFMYWGVMKDAFPDLTKPWIAFNDEHKDWYYRNNLND